VDAFGRRDAVEFAALKSHYEDTYQAASRAAFPQDVARLEATLRGLTDRLEPGARVLDLGCGAGDACVFLDRRGFSCTGVDISERALALARDRLPERLFVAARDDAVLDFADESFEALVCLGVLEHIPHPERTLTECRRVLIRGAPAIFVVANAASPYFLFTRGTGQLYEAPRTLHQWAHFFASAGFAVERIGRDLGPTPSWRHDRLIRSLKLLAHKCINRLPLALTYQFIFELRAK